MANEQNLRPSEYKFTKEDYAKSQASRQENAMRKRDIRRAFEALLEKGYLEDGIELTGAELIALKQFEKAKEGDTKAFEVVRDTVGQKPSEKIDLSIEDESAREVDEYFARRNNSTSGK